MDTISRNLLTVLTWPTVAGAVVAYYVTVAFYRLFLHPLARFPGPKLAAISRWYEGYYDVIKGGKYTPKIAELHKEYGPIVRISPHELHIMDPAFFDKIYRMDRRWDKHAWTYDAFGAKSSTVFGLDHRAHKARRCAIAPFFSKTKVATRGQDLIRRNVDKLSARVLGLAETGTTFNLGAAISAFARDVANEFILGKAYSELGLDDFGLGLSVASQGAGVFWRTTKFIPWFGPLIRAIPVSWVMKTADEGTKSFLRYLQQSEQDVKDTLAAVMSPSADESDAVRNTLIHDIIQSNHLPPADKTFPRIREEIATVTGAGFETTANALRLIIFHVFTDKNVLSRLRTEIASAAAATAPSPRGIGQIPLSLTTLERLPYLTAVLTEGMRLSPGIGTRAGRVTDKDLFYGDQWRIPAHTPIGMTTLLMHTDEKLYPDPMRFDPGRWVVVDDSDSASTEEAARRLKTPGADKPPFYAPFSRGTRMCLGMHLAWAEMYLLVATLVQRFDFTVEGATAEDFEFEVDNFGIGTKAGCNLFATATVDDIATTNTYSRVYRIRLDSVEAPLAASVE
ncbi:cytochrome P450 [Podospora didyma]|uniref:Cytochrome P450 n=1 Tax=Podospora didyma TaxID=330526 RepID=A0AAE0P0N9_9PEZI|nr:cytochrome P450 [Podospora didyma]